MRFFIRLLAVACCILEVRAPPADARRVALVIGNAEYKIGWLANPLNDAEAMAAADGDDVDEERQDRGAHARLAAVLVLLRAHLAQHHRIGALQVVGGERYRCGT